MDEAQKLEILNAIREAHGIATTEKDPIFSLVTISEIVFSKYMQKMDLMFTQHEANLETMTEKYLSKSKELAEVKISNAVEDTYQKLDEIKTTTIKEVQEVKPKQEIPIFYWVFTLMAGAMGYMLCLSIIG